MKVWICLLLASLGLAQDIVFPGNRGSSSNSDANFEERIKNLLVSGNRNTISASASSGISAGGTCTTPDQGEGTCGPILNCPSYIQRFRENPDISTVNFLRRTICRILLRSLHFCCPVSTPGQVGPGSNSIFPTEAECGLPTGQKVIGGTESEIGAWPWLVAIGIPLGNNDFQIMCGGSLITVRHVLSAAHCFIDSEVPEELRTHVRLGDHNLVSNSDNLIPQDIRIASRRTNGYDPFTKLNDIELLILETDAIFNDFVKPVCLPFTPSLRSESFVGETATVVGWGRFSFERGAPNTSPVPLEAEVPIVPLGPCSNVYQTRTLGTIVDNTNLCAGRGSTDSCSGDSGGPLNYRSPANQRYYIIGIVSHGVGCGSSEFPGVYALVSAFESWIRDNVQ